MTDVGFERVLNQLESQIRELSKDVKSVDTKLDDYRLATMTKAEFNMWDRQRRSQRNWAIGIVITVILATGTMAITIILSRAPVIIESIVGVFALVGFKPIDFSDGG